MGRSIFKVMDNGEERFLVWSSTVDAPITFACTAEEVTELWVEEAQEHAEEKAKQMLERARTSGSSSRMGVYTIADVVSTNRAGPDESELTEEEIIEFYVRRKVEPTKKALAEYRRRSR